ncbi:MAG: hypothetical protein CL946_13630 [Ectothiorhodospiraceae bacterium]|nr:hypothetical protein [Ectothiorhodospiraceae bacterium]
MKYQRLLITAFLFAGLTGAALAQTAEDAIRLALPHQYMSARSAAMGNAFTGVADDFSAMYFNPAGLGLLYRSEFSLGLMNYTGETESSFLGNTISTDESAFSMNNIGLAIPFPVQRGSLVFGIGFTRMLDYSNASQAQGYNSQSSYIPTLYNDDASIDLAWQLGLEDTSLAIPITDNVQQDFSKLLEGSLDQWSFGGGVEVSPSLYFGLGINILTGSFRSEEYITETDVNLMYQDVIPGRDYDRVDWQEAEITNTIDQELSGWNATFGGLYNYKDKVRVGLSLTTPTTITVDEIYIRSGEAVFDDVIEQYNIDFAPHIYDISLPMVFRAGVMVAPVDFVRLSADVELKDYSSLEFSNSNDEFFNTLDIPDINQYMRQNLMNTNSFRFGAEILVPKTDLALRAGYAMYPSAYDEDKFEEAPEGLNYDRTTISAGLGYTFKEKFIIHATYLMTTYDFFRFLYDDPFPPAEFVRVEESFTNSALMFQIHYLFQR